MRSRYQLCCSKLYIHIVLAERKNMYAVFESWKQTKMYYHSSNGFSPLHWLGLDRTGYSLLIGWALDRTGYSLLIGWTLGRTGYSLLIGCTKTSSACWLNLGKMTWNTIVWVSICMQEILSVKIFKQKWFLKETILSYVLLFSELYCGPVS